MTLLMIGCGCEHSSTETSTSTAGSQLSEQAKWARVADDVADAAVAVERAAELILENQPVERAVASLEAFGDNGPSSLDLSCRLYEEPLIGDKPRVAVAKTLLGEACRHLRRAVNAQVLQLVEEHKRKLAVREARLAAQYARQAAAFARASG